jgi:hypothetical protein
MRDFGPILNVLLLSWQHIRHLRHIRPYTKPFRPYTMFFRPLLWVYAMWNTLPSLLKHILFLIIFVIDLHCKLGMKIPSGNLIKSIVLYCKASWPSTRSSFYVSYILWCLWSFAARMCCLWPRASSNGKQFVYSLLLYGTVFYLRIIA